MSYMATCILMTWRWPFSGQNT